jgi:RHS repeat-associated protein
MTADPSSRTFVYDAENKQTGVSDTSGTIGTYSYDGDGKRIAKITSAGSTAFFYDAFGKLVEEAYTYVPVGDCPRGGCVPLTVTTSYVYAGSRLLSTEDNTGTHYLTADHLGSPRINTNGSGNVTARHDYMPFGEEIATSQRTTGVGYAADSVRKQFTGYERDGETGLDYAKARVYSASLGRFTGADRIMMEPKRVSDPQGINRYVYARSCPLSFVDRGGDTYIGTDGKEVKIDFNKDGTIKKLGKNATDDLKRIAALVSASGSKTALAQFTSAAQSITKFHVKIETGSDLGRRSGQMNPHDEQGREMTKSAYQSDAGYVEDPKTGKLVYAEVTLHLWPFDDGSNELGPLAQLREINEYPELSQDDAMVSIFGHEVEHAVNQENINQIRGRRSQGGYFYPNPRTFNGDSEAAPERVGAQIVQEIKVLKAIKKSNE